jgi:DNA protecting protein DprA
MPDNTLFQIRRDECPQTLRSLFDGVPQTPTSLYVRALPSRLEELAAILPMCGFAVVGTRRAQPRAVDFTKRVIADLAGSRLVILSGLARGIDAAAHEAALAAGLPTVAVLAGGLDCVYPPENRGLADRIVAAGGVLVSEFGPGIPPRAGMFLKRNRLIAAWSSATWVVQAAHRSGALNTAAWAREMDREVFATPCFPSDPTLAGNERLLDALHARTLWCAQSLGQVWLELATLPGARTDAGDELLLVVKRLTAATGAANAQSLLDWALAQGWSAERFYSELHSKINLGQILEKNGSFLAVRGGEKFEGLKKHRYSD